MIEKQVAIRSKAIRGSARDEPCTLQIAGICNGDTRTTVLAHLPDESHGLSRKSDDFPCVAYACSDCHDMIDGRIPPTLEWVQEGQFYMRRAMTRTLRRLIEKGIIEVRP